MAQSLRTCPRIGGAWVVRGTAPRRGRTARRPCAPSCPRWYSEYSQGYSEYSQCGMTARRPCAPPGRTAHGSDRVSTRRRCCVLQAVWSAVCVLLPPVRLHEPEAGPVLHRRGRQLAGGSASLAARGRRRRSNALSGPGSKPRWRSRSVLQAGWRLDPPAGAASKHRPDWPVATVREVTSAVTLRAKCTQSPRPA
jgi:hypothetical protein